MSRLYVYAASIEGDTIADHLDSCLRVGVGKTAATLALTQRLCRGERPDVVIAFGICGAYRAEHSSGSSEGLKPLDLCLVVDDLLADEGVETPTGFRSLAEMGLGAIGPFLADERWNERIQTRLEGIPIVRAATVSVCSGSDTRALTSAWRTGAAIETMEGAALATVCEHYAVPWVQIRCVSNYAGDRDRGEWQLDAAVTRLQEAVLRIAAMD